MRAVLKSQTAVKTSVQIIQAFVQMKQFVTHNQTLFEKIQHIEYAHKSLQTETAQKFEKVFAAIESKKLPQEQGIFFNGQIFDAYVFLSDLIRSANKDIVVIDNYIDESVLVMLSKRQPNVKAKILTKNVNAKLQLDIKKHNEQYPEIEVQLFNEAHDRFIIIDNKEVYHLGASLKDLGKKWFAFSKMQIESLAIMQKLEQSKNELNHDL